MKSKYIVFFLLIFSLSACDEDFFTTTVDLDPPEHIPRLVIHAFNMDKQEIRAQVSRTTAIQDLDILDVDRYVNDAVVEIYKEGTLIGVFEALQDVRKYNYIYTLNEDMQAGDTYTLKVSHPDFNPIEVSAIVQKEASIQEVSFVENAGVDESGDDRSGVDVRLIDEAGVENYYEVAVSFFTDRSVYLSSLDPAVTKSLEYDRILVSDASFDGEDKIIRIQFYETDQPESITVEWTQISEEHYIYSKTMRQAMDIGDNPFASPVQLKGSVKGGFGFFSLRNISTTTIVR